MGAIRDRGVLGYSAERRGFTLVELMIVVGIIGIVAVIAVPSFNKYMFEAWESEGTRMLLSAYKDQQRFSQERTKHASEFVGTTDITQLYYRVANPKFNLIVGSFTGTTDPSCPNATANGSFKSIGLYNRCPENRFGYSPGPINNGKPLYGMGVEGQYANTNKLHVMMIDEMGRMFLICDAFKSEASNGFGPSAAFYNSYGGYTPVCRLTPAGGGSGGGGEGP